MIPKYRFFSKRMKKMGVVISLKPFRNRVYVEWSDNLSGTEVVDDKGILMQSTGLFDKNGVEIFEGDVVIDDYGVINTIVFTEYVTTDYYGQTHLGFISENDNYVDQFITLPSLLKRGIKVIGNVHELESVEE